MTVRMLDAGVTFVAPNESRERGYPALEGEGRALESNGRLVLRGKVFRLTAWWLKVGAPILLLLTGVLFLVLEDVGLWIGLASVLALVAADFAQQRLGREYEMTIPRGCAYRVTILGGRASFVVHLDTFVVGGGARPPIVEMAIDGRHAAAIEELLRAS